MIEFQGRLILLDIEGTVSPLAFVHEVMFPYAKEHVESFLTAYGEAPAVQQAMEQMARDAGSRSLVEWCPRGEDVHACVVREVRRLMAADVKATGLKLLQGLIWEQGFHNGELRSTLFEDVPDALKNWQTAGMDLRIYSSGSVHAQKLFFTHTEAGDLTPLFTGYYDTTIGSKREGTSYTAIAQDCGMESQEILFISDVVEELEAARKAGMMTALALRPGNKPVPANDHLSLTSFSQIHCA